MKSINLLSVLINIFYYVIFVSGIIIVGFIGYATLFHDGFGILVESGTGVLLDDNYEASPSLVDYLKILFNCIVMFFFIKSIFHLRKATLKMINGEMYDSGVVRNLKQTGVSIILYKIISIFSAVFEDIAYKNELTFSLDFEGYESTIFLTILGLFFILLSKVIQNASELKEEVDLTI